MKEIRLLTQNEIECRVGMIRENGLSLLLYKDARVDMKILDEVFGPFNWQRYHEMIGGNLYCKVSVWDEEKHQWITKMDVGTESYTEKEKGQASDSFKRACVSLGIGRELYTAPFIWIPASKVNIQRRGDRYEIKDRFFVQRISYNENREISGLVIQNQHHQIVYVFQDPAWQQESNTQEKWKSQEKPKEEFSEKVEKIQKELRRTGIALDTVLARYQVDSIQEMSPSTYQSALNSLHKTKSIQQA